MARLADRLLNHPAHGQVVALRGAVEGLTAEQRHAMDATAPEVLERVPAALQYIEGALKAADPELTAAATLERIGAALQNAVTTMAQLPSNPAVAANLEPYLEEALAGAGLLLMSSPVIGRRAGAATTKFNNALTVAVQGITDDAEALKARLGTLDARSQELSDEFALAAETRQKELTALIDSLEGRIDTEKQRLDSLVPQFEAQFTEAQTARDEAFSETQSAATSDLEEIATDLNQRATKTAEGLQEQAGAVLTAVAKVKAEVETLYGVIADTSTTGAFRDEAKMQKTAADKWRQVAVWSGVVAAIIALLSVGVAILAPDAASSAGAIAAKATAALVAAGIAAYAGRQSGRHREREEEAKRLELELVAFPPFIASLDDEQRRAVRQQFADRAFRGRPVEPQPRSLFRKDDSFGVATPELVDAIVAAAIRRATPPAA